MAPTTIRAYRLSGMLVTVITLAACHGRTENSVVASGALTGDSVIEVTEVTVAATQTVAGKSAHTEVKEFRETKNLAILPATKFAVECDVKGKPIPNSGELVVWTTIDFIVAPATRANEKLEISQLAMDGTWAQITEMRDVQAIALHGFLSLEPTHIVFSESELGPVLAAFPLGDAGNLWPWLMRVSIHVQDRNGKPVAHAERIVRLWPSPVRIRN